MKRRIEADGSLPWLTRRSWSAPRKPSPGWKLALSVPEFEIEIQRNLRVKVEWQDPSDGSPRAEWFEEFEAVIVQHELDHLEGTVLLDLSKPL